MSEIQRLIGFEKNDLFYVLADMALAMPTEKRAKAHNAITYDQKQQASLYSTNT